ncbi:MAG: choice-of-anchor tandem repeat NxxGxxAF-containing protein [Phycisphaerae bacterium]
MPRIRLAHRSAIVSLNRLLLPAIVAGLAASSRADLALTKVALSGDAAPGTTSTFLSVSATTGNAIDNAGNVILQATLIGGGGGPGSDEGIWYGQPGSLALQAREGSQAQGLAPGVLYGPNLSVGMLTPGGILAYQMYLTGSGVVPSNNSAMWLGSPGSVAMAIRAGDVGPPGVIGPPSPMRVADNGTFLYSDGLNLFTVQGGSWTTIAGSSPVPCYPPPPYSFVGAKSARISSSGKVAFVSDTNFTSGFEWGIWHRFGVVLDCGPYRVAPDLWINDAAQMLFYDQVGQTALSVWTGGGSAVIARIGDLAPGCGGATYVSAGHAGFNPSGMVAYEGALTGSGVTSANDRAIFLGTPGNIQKVLRKGDPAPGLPGVTVTGSVTFELTALGDSGQVVIMASVSSGGTAVWVGDATGLTPMLRSGQTVQVSPGVSKTIVSTGGISNRPSPTGASCNGSGEPVIFNDDGKLLVYLNFTDSSAGLFVAQITNDNDGDGVPNAIDNCPNTANPGQQDSDGDGVGNACDNCPFAPNANQLDADSDGVGDVCDNCPANANSNQADADADGAGDACDACPGHDDHLDCNSNGVPDGCDVHATPPATTDYASGSVNLPIPDNNPTGVSHSISVPGALTVADVNVKLNITHTYDADLTVSLTHNGTTRTLVFQRGSSGDNFVNTIFDDEAAVPISAGTAPFTGSFKPEQALSAFDGMSAGGAWTMKVVDAAAQDTGVLNNWTLTITDTGRPPVSQDINSNGVPDECESTDGDMNCDGVVNTADLAPFALALVNPAAFAAAHPGCPILHGDMNHDGRVDGVDTQLLVNVVVH